MCGRCGRQTSEVTGTWRASNSSSGQLRAKTHHHPAASDPGRISLQRSWRLSGLGVDWNVSSTLSLTTNLALHPQDALHPQGQVVAQRITGRCHWTYHRTIDLTTIYLFQKQTTTTSHHAMTLNAMTFARQPETNRSRPSLQMLVKTRLRKSTSKWQPCTLNVKETATRAA